MKLWILHAVPPPWRQPLCLHNLAIVHYHRVELDEALHCADLALRIDPTLPGAHFVRAEALLLRGEWAQGWEEYEWRFRVAGSASLMPTTSKPQWDGTSRSDGTLLLIADQGFGDVIQFARYVPWAMERYPDVAIACSVEVRPLLRQIAPDARLFARWEDAPEYTAYCALSGLPRLAGTHPANVPAPVPYLHADPARTAHWAERLDRLAPGGLASRRGYLGWATDPQQRPESFRAAGRLRAAGWLAKRRVDRIAEGANDRSGRKLVWSSAADQRRSGDCRL